MSLTKNFQLAVKAEDQWATPDDAATLFAAGNMSFLPLDVSLEFTPQLIERAIKQGTLTPAKGILGLKTGTAKITHELLSSSTAYILGDLLRACGLMQVTLVKLKVASGGIKKNAVASYLKHGTIVYYGSTGALDTSHFMTIFGDYYDRDPVVWATYQPTNKIYENFLWKAGAAGSTVVAAADLVCDALDDTAITTTKFTVDTAGVVSPGGVGFCPVSRPLHRLSIPSAAASTTITKGDQLKGQTSGSLWQAAHTVVLTSSQPASFAVINIYGHLTAGEALHDVTNADTNLGVVEATVDAAEQQLAGCSIGIGVNKDGVREAISSARGSVTFKFPVGQPATVEFEFQGVESIIADAGNTTGITYPDLLPPIFQNSNLVFGKDADPSASVEYSPCVANVEASLANEINQRQCSNSLNGVIEYEITGRKPTGKIDPELYQESVFATLGDFLANQNCRLFFKFANPTPENRNKFWFFVPSMGMTAVSTGDRNGRATREITFQPNTGTAGFVQHDIDNDLVLIMDNAAASFA